MVLVMPIMLLTALLHCQEYEYFNRNNNATYIDYYELIENRPENVIFELPREVADNIFDEPDFYFEILVENLTAWTEEDYLKVKSIHDWIVFNIRYDIAGYRNNEYLSRDPYITLNKRAADPYGISTLFHSMVRIAGFDSYIVKGYTRTEEPKFMIGDMGLAWHLWNSVKIGENWYLIDITWDFGRIHSNVLFVPSYSIEYLFLKPSIFVETHYPDAPGWLLLEEMFSFEDFAAEQFDALR